MASHVLLLLLLPCIFDRAGQLLLCTAMRRGLLGLVIWDTCCFLVQEQWVPKMCGVCGAPTAGLLSIKGGVSHLS